MAANDPHDIVSEEERMRRKLRRVVRQQPVAAVAIAAAAGAVLGGLLLRPFSRFAFYVVVGYVGNELWNRRDRLGVDDLLGKLAGPDR